MRLRRSRQFTPTRAYVQRQPPPPLPPPFPFRCPARNLKRKPPLTPIIPTPSLRPSHSDAPRGISSASLHSPPSSPPPPSALPIPMPREESQAQASTHPHHPHPLPPFRCPARNLKRKPPLTPITPTPPPSPPSFRGPARNLGRGFPLHPSLKCDTNPLTRCERLYYITPRPDTQRRP